MSTKKRAPKKFVFDSKASAARAPFEGQSTEKYWAHTLIRGFGVIVSKPDSDGNVVRWYAARYGKLQPGKTPKDTKTKLGLVGPLEFGKAIELATGAVERARDERHSKKASYPTLKEAFDAYMKFKLTMVESGRKIKPRTEGDYRERWADFVPVAWHGKTLDELGIDQWTTLRIECTTPLSFERRLRKPVSESRFDGMMRGVISGLYNHARVKHPELANPVPAMKQSGVLTKRTPQKHDYIATENLGPSIQLADQRMRAPQPVKAIPSVVTTTASTAPSMMRVRRLIPLTCLRTRAMLNIDFLRTQRLGRLHGSSPAPS